MFSGAEGAKPLTKDQTTNKAAAQSSVTFIYEAKVAESCRNVTVTWSKNLMNYSLCINVESLSDNENQYTCKIDMKTWQFWGRKGLKSFDVGDKRVDVFWDFRQAKFSTNPEPTSDYYVAIVSDEEVVLLLGDLAKDAYKRTRKPPSLQEPTLLCKKENVYGKRLFCTKTMLDRKEHDLTIENSPSGHGDPELWISIDGFEVIHIMNLNWRFRGNETVKVKDVPLQIFWDVHDWLFSSPGAGNGLFILKPETVESAAKHGRNSSIGSDIGDEITGFCHIIYAWRTD
ncbi:hypothetical protein HS088_TW21G00638 [Tripterygium wilfordii]|uniref:DUF868 family protein n=1 Tax=Tripterygium wilfordii TaxID=458696 RepID=A0A7J7C2W0_TRIWF|nr:uncharacterized protein LOC119987777 [Tripterygium wilfordii]KAF5728490.1 hypothetical protein HS088_TW21G00638 [Tripterygium wilfordii]